LLALPPSPGDRRQIYDIRRELGVRSGGGWHDRRWSFDILGELSQVLGGGDKQNLVAGPIVKARPEGRCGTPQLVPSAVTVSELLNA
jgi:hypothetical protein